MRKLVPTTPPKRRLEPVEVVLEEVDDRRIRPAVEIDLHHLRHLLEELVAVAVRGVGAVAAVDPPDARSDPDRCDTARARRCRASRSSRAPVPDRSAPCASDRTTDRRSAAARTRSGTSAAAVRSCTIGDLVTNHSDRRVISPIRDRARSSSRARSAGSVRQWQVAKAPSAFERPGRAKTSTSAMSMKDSVGTLWTMSCIRSVRRSV